jgi:hypothetical protein
MGVRPVADSTLSTLPPALAVRVPSPGATIARPPPLRTCTEEESCRSIDRGDPMPSVSRGNPGPLRAVRESTTPPRPTSSPAPRRAREQAAPFSWTAPLVAKQQRGAHCPYPCVSTLASARGVGAAALLLPPGRGRLVRCPLGDRIGRCPGVSCARCRAVASPGGSEREPLAWPTRSEFVRCGRVRRGRLGARFSRQAEASPHHRTMP